MVNCNVLVFAAVTFVSLVRTASKPKLSHEEKVIKFLDSYNEEMSRLNYERNVARFDYNTNMTKHNEKLASEMDLLFSQRNTDLRTKAGQFDLNRIISQSHKRQLELLLVSATAKDPAITKRLSRVKAEMQKIYSEAHVPFNSKYIKTLKTEKSVLRINEVAQIFAVSTDAEELKYCWKEWRKSIGPQILPLFTEMVELLNRGARDNGFPDEAEFRKFVYEVDDLEEIVRKFWSELKPIYKELHGYVRYRLLETYPDSIDKEKGIPAHLLGNLWTTSWEALADRVKPYPDEAGIQVKPKLLEKNYNVSEIIGIAEKYFVSLGWPKLSQSFWKKSVFVQPENIQMICQPSAYDMGAKFDDIPDVRMAMCGTVNEYYFNAVHHELGHIYYFMFYADLPFDFRQGANPGFHEAIGDALMLSAKTPLYLKSIGLIEQASNSTAFNLNFLMTSALRTIAFLPYGALMDLWRWEIFNGNIKPEEYNRKWWELRLKYQGILPPTEGAETDLDGAAKFHIAWDIPYIRYFFSTIFQFSFYAQACKDAGYEGPLHLCSLENSKEAGDKLRKMLELGKSKKWPEILKEYTGSSEISAEPLIQYFQPLTEWLKNERKQKNYTIGWNEELPKWSSNAKMINMNSVICLSLVIFSTFFTLNW